MKITIVNTVTDQWPAQTSKVRGSSDKHSMVKQKPCLAMLTKDDVVI